MTNQPNSPATSNRILRSFANRVQAAAKDALVPAPPEIDNGDEARYSDKSGTYTKCIKQSAIGVVDPAAYLTFTKALNSGNPADFAAITVGGARTLNGPRAAWHSIWKGWTAANSRRHRRRRWPAKPTAPNWWNCTGLRCCAT